LVRLAGLHASAVIIEIVNPDGTMARMPELEELCAQHGIRMCSVEQIIEYRLEREALVHRVEPERGALIDTPEGTFTLFAFQSAIDPLPHLALTVGGIGVPNEHGAVPECEEPVLVRMHRRDLLGDIFLERTNPTGDRLHAAMRRVQREGRGAIVYLRPEGAGDDLSSRLQRISRPSADDVNAPDLTRPGGVGSRAITMDRREFGIGGQILRDLGIRKLRVLSNHPTNMPGLSGFGLAIDEFVGLE